MQRRAATLLRPLGKVDVNGLASYRTTTQPQAIDSAHGTNRKPHDQQKCARKNYWKANDAKSIPCFSGPVCQSSVT